MIHIKIETKKAKQIPKFRIYLAFTYMIYMLVIYLFGNPNF